MPLTVELPPDLEASLVAEAARLRTTPRLLALIGIRQMIPAPPVLLPPADAKDMIEYLGDYIGCIASSEEARAAENGRPFGGLSAAEPKSRP